MTRSELDALIAGFGLKVDGWHGGAGKFKDLEIGTGAAPLTLSDFVTACHKAGLTSARVTCVSNPDHPDYGRPYVEVSSFWDE